MSPIAKVEGGGQFKWNICVLLMGAILNILEGLHSSLNTGKPRVIQLRQPVREALSKLGFFLSNYPSNNESSIC